MPLRAFGSPQRPAATRVRGRRVLTWLELNCPRCHKRTYIENRRHRLARTGSEREYAICVHCGIALTLGRLVTHPTGLWGRLAFWRRIRGGATVEAS